jgi:ABC-type sugar transport system ATPase subunit
MATVELKNVKKSFGLVEVIKCVNLRIETGEFVVFVGPSGSGKSTLLRIIAGLETVSSGDLLIDDLDVTFSEPSDRGIAMVFQSYALYPHMSVFENIAFNLRLSKQGKSDIDRRVKDAAHLLQLDELLERSPAQLSGGQRQRVAIGRAIVRSPKVFLFDEPLSNLDASLRVQMRLEIERLHRRLDTTMIYVTHDQVEAMTLADRIVVLNEGEIQQIGSPLDLYAKPQNQFVAGFLGSPKMNFLQGAIKSVSGTTALLRLMVDENATFERAVNSGAVEDRVTIGVRPEMLSIFRDAGEVLPGNLKLRANVDVVEHLGNITLVYLDVGSPDLITAQIMGFSDIREKQEVTLGIQPDLLHVFNAAGDSMTFDAKAQTVG